MHISLAGSWPSCICHTNMLNAHAYRPTPSLSRFKSLFNSQRRQLLFVGGLTSQQHAQGRICEDSFTCCHTETEAADQTFYLTQSQYTHTGPTSPITDPIMPGAWQGSHCSAHFKVTAWFDSTRKNPCASGIRTPDLTLSGRTP